MRHQRAGKKLGRDSAHRKALYANLAGALIEHGRIKTTEAKAKAVKPLAEQMITLGRRGDLAARRQAISTLRSTDVVHVLFAEVAVHTKAPYRHAFTYSIPANLSVSAGQAVFVPFGPPDVYYPRRAQSVPGRWEPPRRAGTRRAYQPGDDPTLY